MSYQPPPSPPLPTFAIKDLCGPANPPAFISISKRRYDATIRSTPDATLLYLDDDDGELITVGSSFELGQRLEEPAPKYIRELRNPHDGKLVHVFDINHTAGSLLEWRDHEAYSSKSLGHRQEVQFSYPDNSMTSPGPSTRITYPILPKTVDRDYDNSLATKPMQAQRQVKTEEIDAQDPFKIDESFNVLDGIEEHLAGLANVLQIAATTLQKAADKTRETDTSVVEDILQGVKGILTQVGSFGVEAFKELGGEIHSTINETPTFTTSNTSDNTSNFSKDIDIASRLAHEAKEAFETRQVRAPSPDTESDSQKSVSSRPSTDSSAKVTFKLPAKPLSPAACPTPLRSQSFLDDSSEDADFTARYPPLPTVRRVRSTIERSSKWPKDLEEGTAAQNRYDQKLDETRNLSPVQTGPRVENPFLSPFASPSQSAVDTSTTTERIDDDNKENIDPARKPLPGAWPDVKIESTPSLPVSAESSGDFFNRMVGRGRPSRYRTPAFNSGLHRSNTTASSNPASRLNGPFDPGFPYDPSSSSSSRPGHFRPYRHHRRSASPPRAWDNRAETGDFGGPSLSNLKKKVMERYPPLIPVQTRPVPDNAPHQSPEANPMSKFDSHRAIRHHRSVPQFYPPPRPPPRPVNVNSTATHTFGPSERANTNFPAAMEPAMPFPPHPTFLPRPMPPTNQWAPWQCSPPTQSLNGSDTTTERAGNSHWRPLRPRRVADSPVSSQGTMNKDFESSNTPPWSSAQPQPQSPPSPPSIRRYSTPPAPPQALPTYFPPPPVEPMQIESMVDKIDECVEQLKMCGFGTDDENLKNRLHVYAVAADGDVTEAVEMIEQDRQMSASG